MFPLFAQSSSNYYYYSGSPALTIVSIVLGLACLGISIYAAIDANKYEDWVWQQSGQSKGLWIALPLIVGFIGCFCCALLGVIPAIIYFVSIKKKLDQVKAGGGGGYGYAQPYQQGYPPQQPYQPGQPGQYPPQQPGQQYPPQQPGQQYPPQQPGQQYPPQQDQPPPS